jgi:flagellar biogenesis protein FliO
MDGNLLNSFIFLSLIILVLLIISLYLKKFSTKKYSQLGIHNGKVISKISLSRNAFLFTVKVGERIFLIGVTDKNITLISELTENNSNTFLSKSDFPNPSYVSNKQSNKQVENIPVTTEDNLSFKAFLKSAFSKGN